MHNIDEAIAHEREKAKEQRSRIGTLDEEYSKKCEECAEEHEQLAEWLEELKKYKEHEFGVLKKDGQLLYKQGILDGYDKAIDDFVTNVKDALITDYSVFNTDDIRIFIDIIDEIVKQLKEGDKMQIKDLHNMSANDWNAGFEEGMRKGYNKAIDDFVNSCKSNTLCQTFGLRKFDIYEIAEHLKVGDKE